MTISSNVKDLATKIGTEIKSVKEGLSSKVNLKAPNKIDAQSNQAWLRSTKEGNIILAAGEVGSNPPCLYLVGPACNDSEAPADHYMLTDGGDNALVGGKNGLTFANKHIVRSVNNIDADINGNVLLKTSNIENDSGYLTQHQDISGKADTTYVAAELAKKADTTAIPTKVSALTNDAGYLTTHQDISGKADASNVYTKAEVDSKDETKVNLNGARGALAGYETVSNTAFSGTVDASSPDSLVATGDITIAAGSAGTCFTKVIRTDSSIAVTLASGWAWNGGEAPSIVAGGILVACWCGSSGMVSYASPSV